MSFELMNMVHMKANDDLNANEVLVLMFLAGFANSKTGQCNPSQQTLADRTRLSRRTITRALGSLEDKGYISRQTNYLVGTRCKATCSYIINAERIGQSDHTRMVSESIGMVSESIGYGQTDHTVWSDSPLGMVTVAQEQGIEQGIEQGREHKEKGAKAPPPKKHSFKVDEIELPERVDREAWHDWVQYKRTTRKPIANQATATKTLNLLARYTPEQQRAMVDYSIVGGYPGLYANQAGGSNGTDRRTEAQRRDDELREATINPGNWAAKGIF